MPANDLRRGPGWWMDLDGEWNPPDLWPESTPPLPGWVRTADGTWHAPVDESAPSDDDQDKDESAVPEAVPDSPPTRRLIGYADLAPVAPPPERYKISVEAALGAAAAAAVTAAMIATGLIVLLMVL